MNLPAPSPALRGLPLRIVSFLVRFDFVRNLLLAKVRKDSRIPELPEVR